MKILIEISARHIHLSRPDADKLFGKNYQLQVLQKLSQIGEFAAKEKVQLVTKRGTLNLRVVGPVRSQTQIELSQTDCLSLGIKAPLRLSGDLQKTPSAQLVGPAGLCKLSRGIIVAERHLHLSDKEAKKFNIKNGQKVSIQVAGKRAVTFHNVTVRVKPSFRASLHVDTDEANAAGIRANKTVGKLLLK